jgi:hypothetical protein
MRVRKVVGHEFELSFQSLRDVERSLSFPCDMAGRIELDALNDYVRNNYLYARAMVGFEFARPTVHAVECRCDADAASVG